MPSLNAAVAEDTFLKIVSGTNIYDMKMKKTNYDSADDDLMSSDGFDNTDDNHRMQAAMKTNHIPINVSTSVNMGDATKSSIGFAKETSREE